jgi:1-carboxybiuret hydrolase subunit AtzG-like
LKGEKSVAEEKPDIARLVDEAAKAIGLPIAPEYRANVLVNYERSLAIAQPLLDVELDDDLTPGPVFRP